MLPEFLLHLVASAVSSAPRPGLQPIPNTRPLTLEAALCPPLLYYVALLFLAPPPPPAVDRFPVLVLKNVLALWAAFFFFRLPLAYHVPFSIGLNYQLGLVGLYGGGRALDAFFISPYLFNHIPRRVRYRHNPRPGTPGLVRDKDDKSLPQGDEGGPVTRPRAISTSLINSNPETPATGEMLRKSAMLNLQKRPKLETRISESDKVENMNDDSYTELIQKVMTGPDPMPVYETATTESGWCGTTSFLN